MTPYTCIRVDRALMEQSKRVRKAAKGKTVGNLLFRTRKPTHAEVYLFGLQYLESMLKERATVAAAAPSESTIPPINHEGRSSVYPQYTTA